MKTNSDIYKEINEQLGSNGYSIKQNIDNKKLYILGNDKKNPFEPIVHKFKVLYVKISPIRKMDNHTKHTITKQNTHTIKGGGNKENRHNREVMGSHPLFCDVSDECSICSDSEDEFCVPTKIIKSNKQTLLNKLRNGMKKVNIIKEEFDNGRIDMNINEFKNILLKCFKVNGPYENDVWLSDRDIMKVLKQFSLKFEDFIPIQFQMIDFIEYENDLKNIEFHKLLGKRVACVLNTDTRGGTGEHWFCLFFDLRSEPNKVCSFEYFDSTQRPPHVNIIKFLKDKTNIFRMQTKKKTNIVYIYERMHQQDSDSCGVYSLYYIWLRLHDVPPMYWSHNKVHNESIYKFRKMLFDRP